MIQRPTLFLVAGLLLGILLGPVTPAAAQVAVRADTLYTMAGPPIEDGMVLVKDGKITAVGKASELNVPRGFKVLRGKIVTPGLIDAHSVVGLSGILNYNHDQDQLETSEPIQPELRALDAYNAHEELVGWVRSFGVTTLHTGHSTGELISGQTLIVKTTGNTVGSAMIRPAHAVAVTLSEAARKSGASSPGTRGKMISMLRSELIKAGEYQRALARKKEKESDEPSSRNLRLETLVEVLEGKLVLLVTADRAQDVASALRLAKEFKLRLVLDSGAEAYLLIDQIKAAKVPVLIHPTMARASGERENLSFETASKLIQAGIPVALQSGYEPYVPKTRVVLFEAGLAAAHGLSFEQALATITRDAAKILDIDQRVGTLQVGKDGDLAIYDGDPFEYTTHCLGVVIQGKVVSSEKR